MDLFEKKEEAINLSGKAIQLIEIKIND